MAQAPLSGDHASGAATARLGHRRFPHRLSLVVLLAGVIATVGLTAVSRVNYLHSERRQVKAQTQLAADSLAVAPVDIQRRLGRAATVAAATNDVTLFTDAIKPSIPTPFTGVLLFRVSGANRSVVASVGATLTLKPGSAEADQLVTQALKSTSFVVTRFSTATTQRLGYAEAVTVAGRTYVTYGEQMLPGNRQGSIPSNSPLADVKYALYFGNTEAQSAVLITNATQLPLHGTTARATAPFGQTVLTLVITPRAALLGTFAALSAWLIAAAGAILTAIMALLTERLLRRRAVAEQLAAVTDQLYRTQRGVAETLQQSLLPQHLHAAPELDVATRYLAGTEGINVGGDWYDLITLDARRVFFSVGDVSGRGLSAATMMSRLRHTITAYACEGHSPQNVLARLSALIKIDDDEHFATVLCGAIDLTDGTAVIANAGHPPPVLIDRTGTRPAQLPVGPPIGIGRDYRETVLPLSPGSILVAYTDGLIERRNEDITEGIDRLCEAARPTDDLDQLLTDLLTALVPHEASDDTAMLALRWNGRR